MDKFLEAAIDEAKKGFSEGGIPIGSVLVIDNKIVQTAMKKNKTWKATGIYAEHFKKFPINNELRNIIKKMMKFVD